MIFYLLLCNILFIPIIFCSNITVSKSDPPIKNLSASQQENVLNRTNGPLLSEGGSIMGSILPETLIMALAEDNHTITKSNEISKNKVVARKGVVYTENTTKSQERLLSSNEKYSTHPSPPVNVTTSNNQPNETTAVLKGKNTTLGYVSKDPKTANMTKKIMKPLILNADILENQTVKSFPETVGKTQHQFLNTEVKSYVTNATKHPGMVMPIVITILLVPMFAVLGYMALRRGQEAWKNRHYKRMDFLLDGMYND